MNVAPENGDARARQDGPLATDAREKVWPAPFKVTRGNPLGVVGAQYQYNGHLLLQHAMVWRLLSLLTYRIHRRHRPYQQDLPSIAAHSPLPHHPPPNARLATQFAQCIDKYKAVLRSFLERLQNQVPGC